MNEDMLTSLLIFTVPIIALIGGLVMGILRIVGRQRLAELARRERIAAIERGLDPDKLPALGVDAYDEDGAGNGRLRRAHGLIISGAVLLAVGIALILLLRSVEPEKSHWMLGLLPFLVGTALIGSAALVWPRKRAS